MEEKELKTSVKQRIFIGVIAVLMLGSMIAGYALIVASGGKAATSTESSDDSKITQEKKNQYQSEYDKKVKEFASATKDDYDRFMKYKSEIKAFNETSANEGGVQIKELEKGSGKTLTAKDSDYLAFYVGYCADESVFDSSFDNNDHPTSFAKVLDASLGMIEGWNKGIEGMKVGGIRRITVPGELAYGDSMEICGGYNKPLRFIIMAVENKDPLKSMSKELDEAYMKVQYANYGIDYDAMMKAESEAQDAAEAESETGAEVEGKAEE